MSSLSLSFNNVSGKFPAEIVYLEELNFLSIGANYLDHSSVKILTKLDNLNELVLNSDLTSIPEEIGELKNLEELDLSANKLKRLPERLIELQKLEKLNLSIKPTQRTPNWF